MHSLIVKFLLIIVFAAVSLEGQISPGDLTKAHAHLEGLSSCTKCHVLGEQVYNSKCLGCHTEIKSLINSRRGYHASPGVKGKDCWSCHSEHHGRNFRIINFNAAGFNHNLTGFELKGAHKKIDCGECHSSRNIDDPELKKRKDTYLGLNGSCVSCHTDYHKGKLGTDCAACHNSEKFSPAPGFNHDKTRFKLTGAHIKTGCAGCHKTEKSGGKEFRTFAVKAFGSCADCHKDVHSGKLGKNCGSCHTTASFRDINRTDFNHAVTGFVLKGKHKTVECSGCHKTGTGVKLKYDKCTDCHKDYHEGAFIKNSGWRDCSACHTENGFSPSLFGIMEHSYTGFKLTGAHLAVPCTGCHLTNEKWMFKSISSQCSACHKNPHGSEISSRFGGTQCAGCHISENWRSINFDHAKTDFPLLGRHAEAGCGECHVKEALNTKEYLFKSLNSGCTGCHHDPHQAQFRAEHCSDCHTFDNWKPEKFNHNITKFPLTGAHEKIACSRCHNPVPSNGKFYIKYKLEDFKCAACHR